MAQDLAGAPGAGRSPATRPAPAGSRALAPAGWSSRLVSLVTFVLVAGGLLVRNRSLFTTRIWEVGDAAANSLLVDDAQHLHLLVGHYSRVGFHHPGPAVLYVQAAGETLLWDLLHVVAGPYNGQVVAVLLLQAAVLAAVPGVLRSWSGHASAAAVGVAVALVWYGQHAYALTSTWMPLVVVAPFLLLVVSAASVASGRTQHLWLLAVSACLLVHAHVEFALFSPALVLYGLAGLALTRRVGPRGLWRLDRRAVTTSLAVVALFALPIVLNTLLHWPGELPKYVTYSSGETARPSPSLAQALHYARQFWVAGEGADAKYRPALLVLAAVVAALLAPRRLRAPLVLLTGAAVLAEALFVVYALVGIDDLAQAYVGTFSWSVPLALLLVVATCVAGHLARLRVGLLAGVAAVAVGVWALSGSGFLLRPEGLAGLQAATRQVEAAVGGAPALLDVGPGLGPFSDATGLLIALERDDRPACVVQRTFEVQVTTQRLCTAGELASGRRVLLREQPEGSGTPVTGGLSAISVAP